MMKSKLFTVLGIMLMCFYLMGTMGFGVHYCSRERSSRLLFFSGELPCNHVHPHTHEEGTPHHDHSCCSTDVFVVDAPAVTADNHLDVLLPCLFLDMLFIAQALGMDSCGQDGLELRLFHLRVPPDVSLAAMPAALPLRL